MAGMANASETYLSPTGAYAPSTPAASARSHSYLSPDQAVASSPLLKDNEYASSARRGVSASGRTSRASSFRLSRDLDSLRWNGSNADDLEFADDDDSFLRPDDDDNDDDNVDMLASDDSRRASMLDAGDGAVLARQDTSELNSYSALSKRADFILASAKRKLNLLEGDIKGARHSLMVPPRTNQALTPSNSLRNPPSNPQGEQDSQPGRNTRINYTSLSDLNGTAVTRASQGHTRVFSETSVPSPRGPTVKGSLGLEHVRNRYPLKNHSMDFNNDRSLGPLIEDEVPTEPNDGNNEQAADQPGPESAAATSNAQVLRNEAEDLKGRLSLIQERVRSDARKRRSYQGPQPNGASRDGSIAQQIQALKQSLDQQEEVIEQLERAEGAGMPELTEPVQSSLIRDPREEWQQILNHDEDRYEADYNSPREYSDDEDDEFESVLEGQEFEEQDPDLDGAHEDRVDAFDYEHFILHSVLGSYSKEDGSDRSASVSTRSNSTERGFFDDDVVDADGVQHKESIASFATAQQNTNESSVFESDSDDGAAKDDRVSRSVRDEHGNSWPMPPSSSGSRHTSTVFSESAQSTPAGNNIAEADDKQNGKSPPTGHRPASRIFAALMGPVSSSSTLPKLDDDDQGLVYAVAEALRHACVKLQRVPGGEQEGIAWRQRMEAARKLLAGDLNLPS